MGNDTPLDGTNHVPAQPRRLAGMASALVAACLVAVGGISACGNDNEADARPRRTTTTERETTTTTQNPEEAEKQAVKDAYTAAVQARIEASAAPNPDPNNPALAATHTSFMLDYEMARIEGLRDGGTAIRYPENSQFRSEVDSVEFEDVDGERVAFLEVCTVDDGEEIARESGAVLAGGIYTIQYTEAMKLVDGIWKLAERRQNVTLEGVAGCALD